MQPWLCIFYWLFYHFSSARIHQHGDHALRIIGGGISVPHSVPHLVAIWVHGYDGDDFCGGILITTKHVLTAASCLDDGRKISVMIFGAHNRNRFSQEQQRRYVGDFIIHEEHNMYTRTHDIGVIVLKEPVKLTPQVRPAVLPQPKQGGSTYAGETAQAYGWGWVHDAARFTETDVLMTVNLTIMSGADCSKELKRLDYPFLYDYEICTSGDNNVGTCIGDTGGPLMLNGVVIGLAIVSTGYCELSRPSKFVNVGQHLEWIQNKTKH